jgi:hypothetical protein
LAGDVAIANKRLGFFQLDENIGHFLRLERLPRIWNTERLVFKRISAIFNFIVNTNFTINPEPIIPLFQHSNWGEAPNLHPDYPVNPV